MSYTPDEVMQYIEEEDVKFIRLAFYDVFGRQKNISIMPDELKRAFEYGIAIDASAVAGFGGEVYSDLLLHPDPSTIAVLPWRPEHGRGKDVLPYIPSRRKRFRGRHQNPAPKGCGGCKKTGC